MPPEKEGDVFDKALAPFNHDDYEDESSTSQSETSSSVPSEKTSETFFKVRFIKELLWVFLCNTKEDPEAHVCARAQD